MKYEYKTVRAGDIASLNILGAVGWRVVPLGTLPGAWLLLEKATEPTMLEKIAMEESEKSNAVTRVSD